SRRGRRGPWPRVACPRRAGSCRGRRGSGRMGHAHRRWQCEALATLRICTAPGCGFGPVPVPLASKPILPGLEQVADLGEQHFFLGRCRRRLGLGFLLPAQAVDELDGQEDRSEEHTSELQSRENLVCRLLPEKKKS